MRPTASDASLHSEDDDGVVTLQHDLRIPNCRCRNSCAFRNALSNSDLREQKTAANSVAALRQSIATKLQHKVHSTYDFTNKQLTIAIHVKYLAQMRAYHIR